MVVGTSALAQDYSMLPHFAGINKLEIGAGVAVKSTYIVAGKITSGVSGNIYTKQIFNAQGQEVKIEYYNEGKLYAVSEYTYTHGKKTKAHQTMVGSTYEFWQTFIYDAAGNLISIIENNNANTNLMKLEYTYDKGKLLNMKYFSAAGTDPSTVKWTDTRKKEKFYYDDKGRVTKVINEHPQSYRESFYKYDESGKLLTIERYDVMYLWDMADYQLLTTETFTYNADGTFNRVIIEDAKTKAAETTIYTYQYNK